MKIGFDSALTHLKEIINSHTAAEPLVIAIDGMSASGKTSFASLLGIPVVHIDDFYRPRNANGTLALSELCGNFDIERFKEEVISNIHSKNGFEYGVFDCALQSVTRRATVPSFDAIALEGAYSCHPMLEYTPNIKLFFEVSREEQKSRIVNRNGEEALKAFSEIWIPAEERYFDFCSIKNNADIIVSTEV